MARKKYLNLHKKNEKHWQGPELCPFANATFDFDGLLVSSPETFALVLKLDPRDKRRGLALMDPSAVAHKRYGRLPHPKVVKWNNEAMAYGDEEYEHLLVRMIRTRIKRDRSAQIALLATAGFELVHEREKRGHVLSTIPADLYAETMMNIREEIIKTGKVRLAA